MGCVCSLALIEFTPFNYKEKNQIEPNDSIDARLKC